LLVNGGLAALLWWALQALHLVNRSFLSAYNAAPYGVGFVALTAAITSTFFVRVRQKIDGANLVAGAFRLCIVPMVLTCFFAPNASFQFCWPFAAPVLLMGLEVVSNRPDSWPLKVTRLLCAVPALFLFPLLIGYFVTTQNGKMDGVLILVVLTIVLLALLAPQLEVLTTRSKWLVPGTCALLAFSLILFGALRSGYDAKHPKPDTISYWLDTNTGKASWISFDAGQLDFPVSDGAGRSQQSAPLQRCRWRCYPQSGSSTYPAPYAQHRDSGGFHHGWRTQASFAPRFSTAGPDHLATVGESHRFGGYARRPQGSSQRGG
jgi:hypothetical protein